MKHVSFFRRGLVLVALCVVGHFSVQAQGVGVGTTAPDASAALDIVSSTKGALLPRLTSAQRGAIANPATGLLMFQTDAPMGFYYNAGTAAAPQWQLLNPAGDNLGNHTATQALNLGTYALTGTGADLGTAIGLGVRADGGLNLGQNTTGRNIYLGYQAGQSNTTGSNNLFSGYQSGSNNTTGNYNLFSGNYSGQSNTTGSNNLFSGVGSGISNTTGNGNLFSGNYSGQSNTTGFKNLFNGAYSGFSNTTGSNNLFSGLNSGFSNTTGGNNLFSGTNSGYSNTTGNGNLFSGNYSGYSNTTGSNNLFSGVGSGQSNTTGSDNLFSGLTSGSNNTTGNSNLFSGNYSGISNTTGSNNLFSGNNSGYNTTTGSGNLFSGVSSGFFNTTGSNNTAVGYNAGFSTAALTNATAIGANAVVSQSNSLVLGGTGANAVSVGIGTSAPTQKLEVAGQIFSNTGGFRFPDNSVQTTAATAVGDNLGNHTAIQALNLQANALTGTGDNLGTTVGVGVRADGGLNLGQNTTGNNIFVGYQAGQSNTSGSANQFIGYSSGSSNTTGSVNLFDGYSSGSSNTTGSDNLFFGYSSGRNNISGSQNGFSGRFSGIYNTTGNYNVFSGYSSGYYNATGSNNTALGANAGPNTGALTNATALGANAVVSQSNSLVLGSGASVGIGTSAPTQKLEVAGQIFSSTGGFRFPDNSVQTTAATTVTAGAPLTGSGTSSSPLGISQVSGNTDGYLSSANFNLINAQQASTTTRVASLETTMPTKLSAVTASAPLSGAGTSGTPLVIATATASTTGALTGADFTTFSNKGTFTLPTFTSGSVLFSNGSTIAQNNASFFWDNANARLGIGTTTPLVPLSVTPSSLGAKLTLWDQGSTTQHYGFGISANQLNYQVQGTADHVFSKGGKNNDGTEMMRLQGSTGNLGIGTATPQQRLDVSGSLSTATVGTQPLLRLTRPDNTNVKYANSLELALGSYGTNNSSQSQVDFNLANGNTDNPDATVMSLQASGNVGIGTTTPTEKLDVAGNIKSSGNIAVDYNNANSGTVANTLHFGPTNSGETIGSKRTTGGNQFGLDFYTASANRMAITVGGTVGIGTSTPAAKLTVQLAGDADQGLRVTDGTTTGNIVIQPLTGSNSGFSAINYNGYYGTAGETRFNTAKNRWRVGTDQRSTSDLFFIDTYNGTTGSTPLAITAAGNVGIGTTTPATKLDVNGNLRLAVRLCPVNQTTSYTLTTADIAYSIFKLQDGAYASSLTLPPAGTGQVEGQELTIVNTANINNISSINGTNTDNGTAVALSGSSTVHAVKYVWAINSGGTGTWYRVQ